MDVPSDANAEMDTLESKVGDLNVLYTIVSYKTPVAAYNDESLEKLMELTVYEDSNIIKKQIASETIKGDMFPKSF